MSHRLTAILSDDKEILLGKFDDLFKAVECAELDYLDYTIFRICEGEKCLVGVRMGPKIKEVFWRIPRNGETRGRDQRVMKIFDKFISIFRK